MSALSMPARGCGDTAERLSAVANRGRRRGFVVVLAINAGLFPGEFGAGWRAASTALQADSLDASAMPVFMP